MATNLIGAFGSNVPLTRERETLLGLRKSNFIMDFFGHIIQIADLVHEEVQIFDDHSHCEIEV